MHFSHSDESTPLRLKFSSKYLVPKSWVLVCKLWRGELQSQVLQRRTQDWSSPLHQVERRTQDWSSPLHQNKFSSPVKYNLSSLPTVFDLSTAVFVPNYAGFLQMTAGFVKNKGIFPQSCKFDCIRFEEALSKNNYKKLNISSQSLVKLITGYFLLL